MRLTVLGSGTLLPDADRHSAAHLLEWGGARLLLDCGAGSLHGFARHRVAWQRITHVALSHFHTDHVGDLAPLLFALRHAVRPPREEPLTLLGPPGLDDFVRALAGAHGDWVMSPGFEVRTVELTGERWEDPGGEVALAFHPTPHTDASLAFRIATSDGDAGYTGDTGPSDEVAAFFAGVDVLVAECSLPDPPELDTHLTPSGVAEMARSADPGLLVLTHVYPPLIPGDVPRLVEEAGWHGRSVLGRDGLVVEVEEGRAEVRSGKTGRMDPPGPIS